MKVLSKVEEYYNKMSDTMYVTGDDSPFIVEQEVILKGVSAARYAMAGTNDITMCVDCGEPIGSERKKAIPSATRCISCETINAQMAKLFLR